MNYYKKYYTKEFLSLQVLTAWINEQIDENDQYFEIITILHNEKTDLYELVYRV